MSTVSDISESEATQIIKSSDIPVLIDCFAIWCGPCKVLGTALEKIAAKYDGRIKIVKVNIDRNPTFKSKYANAGVPRLVLFKGGKQVDGLLGAHPIPTIENMLNKYVSVSSHLGETKPKDDMDWLVKPKAE